MKYTILIVFCSVLTVSGCSPKNESVINNSNKIEQSLDVSENSEQTDFYFESRNSKTSIDFRFRDENSKSWWQTSTVYQVWVRSFYDSDNDGNGDLKGVIKKIDYIKSLNINTILLSPIFESPSYHGYDVTDYYQVEKSLGTNEDFEALLDIAHNAGIKVLLDLPLNHTSDQHPWFQSTILKDKTFEDYYIWEDSLPKGYGLPWSKEVDPQSVWHTKQQRNGYYYGGFGYANPDLNYNNPKVVQEMKLVLSHWINSGVDGFRIDAARHFVEEGPGKQSDTISNFELISDLLTYAKSVNEDVLFVGESFTDMETAKPYFGIAGDNTRQGFDGLFNFEFYSAIRDMFTTEGINTFYKDFESLDTLKSSLFDIYSRITSMVPAGKAPFVFINSHDIPRFSPPSQVRSKVAKIVSSLFIFSPFNPVIYYGEEINLPQKKEWEHEYPRGLMHWDESNLLGFSNAKEGWMDVASWFPWKYSNGEGVEKWSNASFSHHKGYGVESQDSQLNSILNHYRNILSIKSNDPVMNSPTVMRLHPSASNIWFIEYQNKEGSRFVIVNLDFDNNVNFDVPAYFSGEFTNLILNKTIKLDAIHTLQPGQTLVLKRIKN